MARGKIYTNRKKVVRIGDEKKKKQTSKSKKDKKNDKSKQDNKPKGTDVFDYRTGVVYSIRPEDTDVHILEATVTSFLKEKGAIDDPKEFLTTAIHLSDPKQTTPPSDQSPPPSVQPKPQSKPMAMNNSEVAVTFWREVKDAKTNNTYYWNPSTNATSWTLPENAVITNEASERSDQISNDDDVPVKNSTGTAVVTANDGEQKKNEKTTKQPISTDDVSSLITEDTSPDSTASVHKNSKSRSAKPNSSITSPTTPSSDKQAESPLLKIQVSNSSDDIFRKLEYLHVSREKTDELHKLLIQVETRMEDWKSEELSSKFFLAKLKVASDQINAYIQKELPSGWTCIWDRASCRYYFSNASTGDVSWEIPVDIRDNASLDTDQQKTVVEDGNDMVISDDDDNDGESPIATQTPPVPTSDVNIEENTVNIKNEPNEDDLPVSNVPENGKENTKNIGDGNVDLYEAMFFAPQQQPSLATNKPQPEEDTVENTINTDTHVVLATDTPHSTEEMKPVNNEDMEVDSDSDSKRETTPTPKIDVTREEDKKIDEDEIVNSEEEEERDIRRESTYSSSKKRKKRSRYYSDSDDSAYERHHHKRRSRGHRDEYGDRKQRSRSRSRDSSEDDREYRKESKKRKKKSKYHSDSDDSYDGHYKRRSRGRKRDDYGSEYRQRSRSRDHGSRELPYVKSKDSKKKKDKKRDKHRGDSSSGDDYRRKSKSRDYDFGGNNTKQQQLESKEPTTPTVEKKTFVPARFKPKGKSRDGMDDTGLSATQMEMMQNIANMTGATSTSGYIGYPTVIDPAQYAAYYAAGGYDPNSVMTTQQQQVLPTAEEPPVTVATEYKDIEPSPPKEVTNNNVKEFTPEPHPQNDTDVFSSSAPTPPAVVTTPIETHPPPIVFEPPPPVSKEVPKEPSPEPRPQPDAIVIPDGNSSDVPIPLPPPPVTTPPKLQPAPVVTLPTDNIPPPLANSIPEAVAIKPPTDLATPTDEQKPTTVSASDEQTNAVTKEDSITSDSIATSKATYSNPPTSYSYDPSQQAVYAAYAQQYYAAAANASPYQYYTDPAQYAAAMNYYAAYQAAYSGTYNAYYQQQQGGAVPPSAQSPSSAANGQK